MRFSSDFSFLIVSSVDCRAPVKTGRVVSGGANVAACMGAVTGVGAMSGSTAVVLGCLADALVWAPTE